MSFQVLSIAAKTFNITSFTLQMDRLVVLEKRDLSFVRLVKPQTGMLAKKHPIYDFCLKLDVSKR